MRNKPLILKPFDLGHEIKIFEFKKIDDTKIDEGMNKILKK